MLKYRKIINLYITISSVTFLAFSSLSLLWIGLFNICLIFIWYLKNYQLSLKFYILQECCSSCSILFFILRLEIPFLICILIKSGLVPLEYWRINFIKPLNNNSFISFIGRYKIIPLYLIINLNTYFISLLLILISVTLLKIYQHFLGEKALIFYRGNFTLYIIIFCRISSYTITICLFCFYLIIISSFKFKNLSFLLILLSLPPTLLFFIKILSFIAFTQSNLIFLPLRFILGWGLTPYLFMLFRFLNKKTNTNTLSIISLSTLCFILI